jgi:hypothetical protein
MSCKKYRKNMSAFLDGELSPAAQEKLFLHLRSCFACRNYFENLTAIQEKVKSFEPVEPPDNYSELAASHVVKIIAESQKTLPSLRKESPLWLFRRQWLWVWPSLLIIILGVFLYYQVSKKSDLPSEAHYFDYQENLAFLSDKIESDDEVLATLNDLIEQEIIGLDLSGIDYHSLMDYFYLSLEELPDEAREELLREMMVSAGENGF